MSPVKFIKVYSEALSAESIAAPERKAGTTGATFSRPPLPPLAPSTGSLCLWLSPPSFTKPCAASPAPTLRGSLCPEPTAVLPQTRGCLISFSRETET